MVLLLAPVFGQSAPSHFSVDASAVGFSGGAQTSAASIAGGWVALTKRVSIGYEQVNAPAISAAYYFGRAGYTVPLKAMLGKKISSSFVFDPSPWSVSFSGGIGVLRQTLSSVMQQHIATEAGASLLYTANGHIGVEVVSGQWLHSNLAGPAGNQFVFTPNSAAISTGLQITF